MSIASRLRNLERKGEKSRSRCHLFIICADDNSPDPDLECLRKVQEMKQKLTKIPRGDRVIILDPYGYADEFDGERTDE